MYRTIDTAMWSDPKFRALSAPGRLLFIYLITNPHAHVSGIYYLPTALILHESGLKPEALDTLWDTLSGSRLALRDEELELIWVVNMLRHQGKGAKNARSAAHQLHSLHKSKLIKDYLKQYPQVRKHFKDTVSDRVSGPSLQEQEQEQEQEKKPPTEVCDERPQAGDSSPTSETEPANGRDPPVGPPEKTDASDDRRQEPRQAAESAPDNSPTVLAFPVKPVGKGKGAGRTEWPLTEAKLAEYREAFPGLDVMATVRHARQWCIDNPPKRKTFAGMPGFLTRWLGEALNRPPPARSAGRNGTHGPPPPPGGGSVRKTVFYGRRD